MDPYKAHLGQCRAPYIHRSGHDDHEGAHRLQRSSTPDKQPRHDKPNAYRGDHNVWRRRDEPTHRDTPYNRPPLAGYGLPMQLRYGQPGYGQPKAQDCAGQLIVMAQTVGQVPVAHEVQLAAGKGAYFQLDPQQLSRSISQAPSTHEVFRLLEAHGAIFNHIHAAN
eukprot:6650838-Prymnesium_polylepis.1